MRIFANYFEIKSIFAHRKALFKDKQTTTWRV